MNARIDQLWPKPGEDLNDDALLAAYAQPGGQTWLRMNFIASIDGAISRWGRSGELGDEADRRVFDLLRRPAHAIMVAAGTARVEKYGAMRLDDASVAWRITNGLPPQPVFVLVTRSLDLDPSSPIFTQAPVRPIIYTTTQAPERRRVALAEVADVVQFEGPQVDFASVTADLQERGHTLIHCEGGPSLFGSLLAAGVVDELCLTIAPTLESGSAPRVATGVTPTPTDMRLATVLRAVDELLLRYVRA